MTRRSAVVIDAGVGILQVIADPLSEKADSHWSAWIRAGIRVCAPKLWLSETTSALHKIFMQNLISESRAREALEALLNLNIELHDVDVETCVAAFNWATSLNQYSAYDGFYLTLAEKLGAPFWTTDQRLVNRSRQLGVTWVNWIGE
jgi:predicted nucleic acid-binding protein